MKSIKFRKEFYDLIKSGEKTYEFRKLSKGIVSGIYRAITMDGTTLGKIELTPIAINLEMHETKNPAIKLFSHKHGYFWIEDEKYFLNKKEQDFVQTNYIDKGIDFVAYEVKEVK